MALQRFRLGGSSTRSRISPARERAQHGEDKEFSTPPPKYMHDAFVPGDMTTKLAQEIHEEFLVCKICLEQYKNPKCLSCLHTFCEQCIENHVMSECTYKKYSDYREFTCPLCRKRTTLPVGGVKKLPDNFLVSSLGEVIGRQRPSKFPFCDICKSSSHRHREAAMKCLDCTKLLCKSCVDIHKSTKVTSSHSLFDLETEKDILCKDHEDEVVRFYCEGCETCICVLCTFNEHKDHDILNFNEAVEKYKGNMEVKLAESKKKIDAFERHQEVVGKCDTQIKQAEQKIRDISSSFVTEIRRREKDLIDELHKLFGAEIFDHIKKDQDARENIDNLKNTCNLTEVILKGKDVELLLVKKQVMDKLNVMSDFEVKDVPRDAARNIKFIPGTVELGYLEDLDRPHLSKKRFGRSTSSNTLSERPDALTKTVRSTEVQTEPPPSKPLMRTQGTTPIAMPSTTVTSQPAADSPTAASRQSSFFLRNQAQADTQATPEGGPVRRMPPRSMSEGHLDVPADDEADQEEEANAGRNSGVIMMGAPEPEPERDDSATRRARRHRRERHRDSDDRRNRHRHRTDKREPSSLHFD